MGTATQEQAGGLFATDGDATAMAVQASSDLEAIAAFIDEEIAAGRGVPQDQFELAERWEAAVGTPLPTDPFDGYGYGYTVEGSTYLLWSAGPDGESATADDIDVTNQ